MVIYDLLCSAHHQFEAWFKSPDDFQQQKESDLLSCPVCDTKDVRKIPSATYVNTKSMTLTENKKTEPQPTAVAQDEVNKLMVQIKTYIENNSVDVGTGFVEEVKKMHYGETPDKKNIRGVASSAEVAELREEGINTYTLPDLWVDKQKLN